MKKLSNFMWLLAIVLTATFTFVSCGDDKDNPDVEKGKVEVNPEKVFVNGMPKVMDGYVFTRDFKGRLSSMYNKKEKGLVTFDYNNNTLGTTDVPNVVMTVADSDNRTVYKLFLNKDGYVKYCDEIEYRIDNPKTTAWNFEYNSDGQLVKAVQTKGGTKTSSIITYNSGNAVETVTISEKDGQETDHYKIYYTSKKITLPIANKGCLMAFDGVLGVDLDHLQYAYFAGMLGKATKHLPIYNMDKDNDKTTFDWTFNDDGFPTKIVIKSEDERENSNIVW
ncbi:DUF4595 domain-containing protein [Prevotella intermedia]|uniref:DUF4595 domain-containing protein n=1 Tax=Prevotella intermedia ZT TaxID=1347790 RepID=A0AAP0UZV3_PREIN|nr:DUF4595 domain-containing protein [Prevotella intermedia]ATV33473.1 DUF4595 domain-containing protein [Prevotella intermedia]ATV40120.1 DUF4595 domain-containing protein [Prevotella intermedia]KJJ86320.1 hypothetical protein M573_130017 [Prevotella intermedia ZT]